MATNSICQHCGSTGTPRTVTRGSFLLEVLLWLTFLVPGILYSLWRLSTRQPVCRQCGASHMVPLHSPRGQKLLAEFHR